MWVAVIVAALGCYALKLAGLSLPESFLERDDVRRGGVERDLAAVVRERHRPHLVLAGGSGDGDGGVPLLAHRSAVDGKAAAYVCEGFACRAPVTSPEAFRSRFWLISPARPVP